MQKEHHDSYVTVLPSPPDGFMAVIMTELEDGEYKIILAARRRSKKLLADIDAVGIAQERNLEIR